MIRIGMRWTSTESKIEDLLIRMARMGVNGIERFEIGYHHHEEIDYSTTSAASPPPVAPGPQANRFPGPRGPRINVYLGPGAQKECLLGPKDGPERIVSWAPGPKTYLPSKP